MCIRDRADIVHGEIENIEMVLTEQLAQAKTALQEKCNSANECFSGSLKHFRRQKRIEPHTDSEKPDPSMEKLRLAIERSPLSFTVAIGPSTLRHAANDVGDGHPVRIYEDLRSQVDKACYVAKQSQRGSIVRLVETAKDDNDNVICFAPGRFNEESNRLYNTPPKWGIRLSIKGTEQAEACKLVTCICDSFSGYYGKDANVIARIESEPEVLVGIFDPDESITTPSEILFDIFSEQWKKSMGWNVLPRDRDQCDVQVLVAAVNNFKQTVNHSWKLEDDMLWGSEFPFKPGHLCFTRSNR